MVQGPTAVASSRPGVPSKLPDSAFPSSLPPLLEGVLSSDSSLRFSSVQGIRKLLSATPPPIQSVIDSGVVPRVVELLGSDLDPTLQLECAWVLTNIASGDSKQTTYVLRSGALPVLVRLLSSPDDAVKEQVVWAVGNLAGDGTSSRDVCLAHGVMEPLVSILQSQCKEEMLKNAVWCLSNLCKGKGPDRAPIAALAPCLPALATVLHTSENAEVLTDAAWCYSYVTDGENERIQAVLESGVAVRLIQLLGHPDNKVVVPVLRAVGNIVTGTDDQTRFAIQAGTMPALKALLEHPNTKIRKEACWALSNVAASFEQIQAIVEADVVPKLVGMLGLDGEMQEVKKEILWVFGNALDGGSEEQVGYFVRSGVLRHLCDAVSRFRDDKDMRQPICAALDGLAKVLKVGEAACSDLLKNKAVVELIDETDMLDAVARMAQAKCEDVTKRAATLKENFVNFICAYLKSSLKLSPVPLIIGAEAGEVEDTHPSYKLCKIVQEVRSAAVRAH